MAAKKYRMLNAGEVVLPTDQVYVGSPVNQWLSGSLNCGKELPDKYEGGYRRLDTKEAGQTVRAKRPVQQRKVSILSEENFIEYVKKSLSQQQWRDGSHEFLVAIAYRRFCLMLKTKTIA